ncbi:MAG TPA: rhodanese-like domain-containing protein [Candidatus Saccharimonadia bacterium]|nr:rhodanese-like domain-containing protein [Candidatus Saccharimonadia bacterium]
MKLISLNDLRMKIAEKKKNFKLVFTLGTFHFQAKHIPGSLDIDNLEKALAQLKLDDDVVVYCSSPSCPASIYAYHKFKAAGFKHLARFAGGISEWEDEGLPIESEE